MAVIGVVAMTRASASSVDQGGVFPKIPGYEILRRVGRGGMGEVFAARQLALGRLVAVKCISLDVGSDSEKSMGRFRREAELMAKVSHPNVLSVFDFGAVDGLACSSSWNTSKGATCGGR